MASKQATIHKPVLSDFGQRLKAAWPKVSLPSIKLSLPTVQVGKPKLAKPDLSSLISVRVVFILVITIIWAISIFLAHKNQAVPDTGKSLGTSTVAKPLWCEACRATKISIPSILFADEHIALMTFDQSQKTWPTPITGIATPQETVANNIIVFGHSKWSGKVSNFARISQLKIADAIYVTDQNGKISPFVVESLTLVDRFDGTAVHAKDSLQLTLLTSARQNGEWLLPSKVSLDTQDLVKDTSKYAIFVVTAKPADIR